MHMPVGDYSASLSERTAPTAHFSSSQTPYQSKAGTHPVHAAHYRRRSVPHGGLLSLMLVVVIAATAAACPSGSTLFFSQFQEASSGNKKVG